MSTRAESGLRDQRIDFAREGDNNFGGALADPSFLKYSDTVNSLSATPEAVLEERRGLGSADPADFQRGPESHEVTINYDLVKWFSATGDAAYDGLVRDADNLLPDSHTLLVREDKGSVPAEHTVAGNASYSTRIYLVGRGGLIDEVAITGDPSDSQPISVELTYLYQYLRTFQIDQPGSSTYLTLRSTDSGDTGLAVEVESEGGTTSETVSLDGSDATTVVSTSNQYGDVDGFYVSSEHAGDIVLSINDGSDTAPTEGDEISRLPGTTTYGGGEYDYGVPVLGTGSRETVGSLGSPETFIGDRIGRYSTPMPHEINSATLTVSNNVEETEVASGYGMSLHPGNRNITLEPTLFSENTTYDLVTEHLQNNAQNMTWEMTGGTLTLNSAVLSEPGEIAKEEGQAVMSVESVFTAAGISIA